MTKRIIPCLDVTGGKVVKGVSFENLQIVGDPVALGKKYSDEGADELVFLDISASKDERETLYDVVAAVAREVFIPFTVGGGIGSVDQMRKLLQLGADKISINTAAIKNPALITEASRAFGEQCVVVAIDAKKKGDSYKVFLKGGTVETELDAVQWAKEAEKKGAGEILLTSMDKDGTRSGYDIELLRQVSDAVRIPVIASGGAGSMEDMKAACIEGKADAVLVASLLHYGELTIPQVKKYLSEHGIAMRI
ncbi:imidazole glycerol phosphate synthase subunit HisF [Candidatus Kaiserbacteria bacterium RIFCSPHIGHO2_01_FULL_53_29]|uniref:Imidazole glycerol phosphate synthase subunit HisF n=2 Tax=Candidatus Kaiseribacteriota TaxID=1752734 RepID=A0A1F6CVV1_9BACT|nr:MAG: imidazole glycerol phosphate synthase subunit HisF [Candidatus Kaiserbacteria bacterium RIFCSPHIGHO2_01_FULL_53_29]